MLFNSLIFLFFASIFYFFWKFVQQNTNLRLFYLTLASFIFYGWWDWRFLFLIIISGLIDFFAALFIVKNPQKKHLFLTLSILGNIGSLMIFKYSGFFAENIDALFSLIGYQVQLKESIPDFFLITPVGISFYTFQSMSYTLDVYKNKLEPTKNILHFFAYLSMFPQLVAGPIVRAKDMLPQLLTTHKINENERWLGLKLIVHGYFKKVVIADSLAPIVTKAFGAAVVSNSTGYWWGVISAFAFQIYCDFSGYSDIARGLAKWMGYDFPDNFNHPYISTSLREFWTRWHISLSTWFRDYLYIPLGGSRGTKIKAHINMWITMLVSGLWHGASWTYIIWASIHAFFLSFERFTKWPDFLKNFKFGKPISLFFVVIQVWVAWVFFRAESVSQAFKILKVMFAFNGNFSLGLHFNGSFFIVLIILRELYFYFNLEKKQSLVFDKYIEPAFIAVSIAACVYLRGPGSEFIYFQF